MPSMTIYIPEDKTDLYVWFKSLPKDKRSKVAVSALEAAFKTDGKAAKPKDIKKVLQDKQAEEMDAMRKAVISAFSDVAPTEKEWIKDSSYGGYDVGGAIKRRLQEVAKKQPDTLKKEVYFYFRELFPTLAKEAGLE